MNGSAESDQQEKSDAARGAEAGGNLWRTTGDISDNWQSLASIAFRQPDISRWCRPGRWNDPDMLVIGKVGWGPDTWSSRLTANEQILHITVWALRRPGQSAAEQ